MAIDAVAVHHSDHPQIGDSCEIFNNKLRVLISLARLRDEASPCLEGYLFYKFRGVFSKLFLTLLGIVLVTQSF